MDALATHPAATETSLVIPLAGTGAPQALLSLLAAGDMGFGDDENAGRRGGWLASLGFDPRLSMSPDLVHSRTVVEATVPSCVRGVEADGMIAPPTLPPGAGLVITVADCMPIYMYDSGSGACGLLHSGWKGTGILANALRLMSGRYGTQARDVSVTFGPRIGACCYHVDEERASLFASEFGSAAVRRDNGRPSLDLVAANMGLAESLGIGSVHVVDACTFCDDNFGSFRRQGAGHFTRMAAVLGYQASSGHRAPARF